MLGSCLVTPLFHSRVGVNPCLGFCAIVGGVVLISEKPVFYLIHCYMLKESGCEKFN